MDICQLQIHPVDNGFFIQWVNADGSNLYNPRQVAKNREELVEAVKTIAEGLYTKEPPKVPTIGEATQAVPDGTPRT